MKYRAMQMTLVIHYAEELRRIIVETVQAGDSLRKSLSKEGFEERAPKGSKAPFKKALKAWVADKLLSDAEAEEIRELTDFRNDIAHRMHLLTADLSQHRFVRDALRLADEQFPKHDFKAADRMKALIKILYDRTYKSPGTVCVASLNDLYFETAEKALWQELNRLAQKIDRQYRERRNQAENLRKEVEAMRADFSDEEFPGHPLDNFDNGRLTPRGEEQAYRLFDKGYSPLAVAHVMHLSLRSAKRRMAMWKAVGGESRKPVDIQLLPERKFYRLYDD